MNSILNDRDDDVALPHRGNPAQRPMLRDDMPSHADHDREFTLSTGTVLGLFFALALICAVFFGFGYSMGRKSTQAAAETATASAAQTDSTTDVTAAKPTAGAPAQPIPGYLSQAEVDKANRGGTTEALRPAAPATTSRNGLTVVVPTSPATAPPARTPKLTSPTTADIQPRTPAVGETQPRAATPAVTTVARNTPVPIVIPPATAASTSSYVQIAAVSHQEDADVLLSALKRRGYSVFTRASDADKLIHVQVGPFATKKDAEIMRQRLLSDGYNAIVK